MKKPVIILHDNPAPLFFFSCTRSTRSDIGGKFPYILSDKSSISDRGRQTQTSLI